MAKGKNQKLKILYLMKIFLEKTDDGHGITMPEIIASLKMYGIEAERKSIYDDIEALRTYGIDIIGEQRERVYSYHVGNRRFELAELKLLVDSVQASKFITVRKSHELIRKIEGLASRYEAKQLHRQVYVAERIKTMNESIYYNVDLIHAAINREVKVRFQYYQWNVEKKMELRHGGEFYCISPWALCQSAENYYLVGFDEQENKIKHYRVDKMLKLEVTEDKREGEKYFENFDMAAYMKRVFGMFDGETETVKLELENSLAGVVLDRFGKNLALRKTDEQHFVISVDVAVSRQFLGWVIALGSGARITGPERVLEQMREEIRRLNQIYEN